MDRILLCTLACLLASSAPAAQATVTEVTVDAPEFFAALGLTGRIYTAPNPAGTRFTAWMEL
jgi:hypothetical protein